MGNEVADGPDAPSQRRLVKGMRRCPCLGLFRVLLLALLLPTRNWVGGIRHNVNRSGTVIDMTDQGPNATDEGATILSFPTAHEAPRSSEVDLEGEPVTVIYLPWPHEVDGAHRPAGLYYRASDTAGFYPDPAVRGLDAVLEEARPWLQRHLRLIREPGEGPAGR